MKHARKSIALTALACALGLGLTGCGGGGGDSDTSNPTAPSVRSTAEGAWCVTGSSDAVKLFTLLDDGSAWGFYGKGNCISGFTELGGIYHGTYTADGHNVSITGTQFDITAATASSANFSGTVLPKGPLSLTQDGTSYPTFSGLYRTAYDTPASLSSLAGRYSGGGFITISTYDVFNSDLTVSGSTVNIPADANGCSASGTVTPHKTAHGTVNLFDLSLQFSGANCELGNGAIVTGIVFQNDSNTEFQALAFTPDEKGFFFVGARQ